MIIGHQKILQFLKKSAELGKISHAYLFYGQAKLGKKTIALEFIKWLFNEDGWLVDGVQKRQHPDFILIEPVKKEIQISQIRDLNWKISLKSSSAPFKAAIIDQAHCMNQEAQSCFLKTLEEPKGKTLLILITEYPERLFPTILSRVQKIKFYPVKKDEIENYLQKNKIRGKVSKEIVRISLGKPGVAIDFATMPPELENQKKVIEDVIKISNSDLAFRFQYVKKISGPAADTSNLREILNIWLSYFRDILTSKVKNPNLYPNYTLSKLKNILKLIQNTNFLISTTNVNPRLALEILMLEI